MNVETTPELILAAAEKCPQAKEALKTLFPKVFEDDVKILVQKTNGLEPFFSTVIAHKQGTTDFLISAENNLFHLNKLFNWEIKEMEDTSHLVLIPTRK